MGARKRKTVVCGICKAEKPNYSHGTCSACWRLVKRRLQGAKPKWKCRKHLASNWLGGRDEYCVVCGASVGWRHPSQIKRNKTGFRCAEHRYVRIKESSGD